LRSRLEGGASSFSQPVLPAEQSAYDISGELSEQEAAMVARASHALLHCDPGIPGWWPGDTATFAELPREPLSLDQWAAAQKPDGAGLVDWSSPQEIADYLRRMPVEWKFTWAVSMHGNEAKVRTCAAFCLP
jgi:hypothetical protein